ncbi:MAG: PAS domain S-box protein [Candidatus Methanoperedens sp.]|nr:PAS domain S-box protein [Candidatus Methanoperedens sp.]
MKKLLVVENDNVKHMLKLLTIVVSVFLIGYFIEEAIDISATNIKDSIEAYLEISTELIPVFVSFSIFAMTWYQYNKSRDNHSLFMGGAFLIIGFLILFHMFSYPFMPDLITPNSYNKAAFFFIESRLVLAILLLASVYIYKDTLPKLINRGVLLSFAIALLVLSLAFVLLYNKYLFTEYNFNSFSNITVFLLSIISAIILYASYLYAKRFKETGQKDLIFLIYGSIILLFSNLVYFSFEFSGHFLLITGFFFMHLALYRSCVELPYEKLALAEDKLRVAAEEKYYNLFDNANDAIITTDLEDRITSWNKAAERLFGWTEHEVMGKMLSSLLVPEYLRTEREQIVNNALTGRIYTGIETVRLRKDGTKMDVSITISPMLNADNEVIGLSGIIRDITERKRSDEALKIALKNWQNTFNAISDSVFILDSEGRIVQSNSVYERMSGINTEDLIGNNCCKILYGTAEFVEDCPFRRMKQIGMRESFEFEDKEHKLWFQVTIDPVYNESGELINAVHIMHDATELKKIEDTRYENIKLVLANKAKSDFLAHMSHELRTPLNSIIGFSELLVQKAIGELNKKQEHYINNIITSGIHLLAIINDILDLSKVEAGKIEMVIEKISVSENIDDAVNLVKERAMKHNIVINKDIDSQLEIEADRLRLKQILFNLLSNAVKFSKPEGGTVTITAKKEDDMVRISFSDTGIGIREKDMKKLFIEFEQIDSSLSKKYGGTGLGLAITKKLVDLHGGKIRVESKYGEGSTFTFLMPIVSKKEEN